MMRPARYNLEILFPNICKSQLMPKKCTQQGYKNWQAKVEFVEFDQLGKGHI